MGRMNRWILGIVLALLNFCTPLYAFNGSGSVTSGGKTRSFVFYASGSSVVSQLPLLFVFHGDNSNGSAIRSASGFDAIADAGNFLVVYPNADTEGWNRAIDQTKDSQFVSDMIDYFCSNHHIDARKVYATGFSAGGYMTYNLAVNLPDRVAAFVPVSANMYANDAQFKYFGTSRFKSVPICHIHGDQDQTVAYIDADHTPGAWNEWPLSHFAYYTCGTATYTSVSAVVAGVTKLNFCAGSPPATKEISMIRVAGKGHESLSVPGFNPAQAAWDFVKNYSIANAATCVATPEEPVADGTIYSNGRSILGPCGEVFIPRGVNYSLADDWEFPANINGDPTHINDELSAEIIKAKPNTVRIQWYVNRQSGWKPYSVADLDVVITRFRNAGIVSVIDIHDLTCSNDYTTFNSVILPWWKQQSVLDMLHKHRQYVIANIANEFGNVMWTGNQATAYTTWLEHYKNVITQLRNAGIEVPLMIDAPDCGQNLTVALQAGGPLKQHDPLHKIIMSAHAYWYQSTAIEMENRMQQIAAANFPVVLGEIANKQDESGTPCAYSISQYTSLLQSCQAHDVGWLAWTWTDDWCPERRLSSNGNFTSLTNYGKVIVSDPVFGLSGHAEKLIVSCAQNPLPVKLLYFMAKPSENQRVWLSWATAGETNFRAFVLERSADTGKFKEIVQLAPKDDGKYAYEDKSPERNVSYYRLKMEDMDNTYAYSKIIAVRTVKAPSIIPYPSPATDFIQVDAETKEFPAKVSLFDSDGNEVRSQLVKNEREQVRLLGLKQGVYVVRFKDRVIGKVIVGK